jgi:hypothetical protein
MKKGFIITISFFFICLFGCQQGTTSNPSSTTNYTMTWLYNNGSPLTSELPAYQKVTISSYNELCYFIDYINSGNDGKNITFTLTADVIINSNYSSYSSWPSSAPSVSWTPIGNSTDPFDGIFDGNNKTIYGVYISATTNNIGFFGYANSDSIIENLSINDSYIVGVYGVGTVCGISYGSVKNCSSNSIVSTTSGGGGGIVGILNGTVKNCSNSGAIKNTGDTDTACASGGIVGESKGTVSSCTNSGTISGVMAAGGIIGSANSLSITADCSNSGAVTGTNWHAGGVVGSLKGCLYNSWNTGSVTCSENAGGVVGSIGDTANTSQQGFAYNCYASGTVSATYAGTFAGFNYATIQNCYSVSTILSNNSQYTNAFCGCQCVSKDGTSSVGTINDCYWLSSTASLANSYSQSAECSVSSCGSFSSTSSNITAVSSSLNYTGTLLNVLNSWVTAQNNEKYAEWIEDTSSNDGYPVLNN